MLLAPGEADLGLDTREFIAEFGEFDLELGLPGLGPLAEDLQDEREPIDDFDPRRELLAQVVRLIGAGPVVQDNCPGTGVFHELDQFGNLAGAEIVLRILGPGLGEDAFDAVAGGAGQLDDLGRIRFAVLDTLGHHGRLRALIRHSAD